MTVASGGPEDDPAWPQEMTEPMRFEGRSGSNARLRWLTEQLEIAWLASVLMFRIFVVLVLALFGIVLFVGTDYGVLSVNLVFVLFLASIMGVIADSIWETRRK